MATGDDQEISRTELIRCAVPLIAAIRSEELDTEECDAKIAELRELHPYPRWLDLLFWESAELTDEEVMVKALEYRPVGDSGDEAAIPSMNLRPSTGNGGRPRVFV